ncbi:hypothetical protein [Streptomyces sp. NPDC086787]|uniref:hypothetical protein n=1 Tax=Streptomyces sp. NPDC086787 TaxID=3365759 RepID=UPI0037F5490B
MIKQIEQVTQIKRVSHRATGNRPGDFALALQVAGELHTPPAPVRLPEITAPQMMGLRMPAARPHRHKVPLKRLTAVRGC